MATIWPVIEILRSLVQFACLFACTQVLGISHLSRDLKNCDEFIACGREAVPFEMRSDMGPAAAPPAAVTAAAAGPAASRRRAPTPYHAPALEGINADNANDTVAYSRLKKGSIQPPIA